jgi:hypothetical protein
MDLVRLQELTEALKPTEASLKAKKQKILDKMDLIVQTGGRIAQNDPLMKQLAQVKKDLKAFKMVGEELVTEGKTSSDFNGIARVVDDALADLKDKLGKGGNLATLMKSSGASKLDTEKDEDGKNILNRIITLTTEYKKAVEKLMTAAEFLVMQFDEGLDTDGDLLEEAKKELSAREKKMIGWYIVDPDGDNAGYRDSASGKKKAERDCEEANKGQPRGNKSKVVYGYIPDGSGDVKKLPAPVYEELLSEAADYDDSSDFTEEFYKMQGQIIDIKGKMKNPRWIKWMKVTDTNFGTECETPARAAIQAIGSLEAQIADIDAELDKAS